jgi:hypothetical protein
LEGSSYAIFEILSWHLLGRTEENHKKAQPEWPVSQQRFKPRTSHILECYLYDDILG